MWSCTLRVEDGHCDTKPRVRENIRFRFGKMRYTQRFAARGQWRAGACDSMRRGLWRPSLDALARTVDYSARLDPNWLGPAQFRRRLAAPICTGRKLGLVLEGGCGHGLFVVRQQRLDVGSAHERKIDGT